MRGALRDEGFSGTLDPLVKDSIVVSIDADNAHYLYRLALGPGEDPVLASEILEQVPGVGRSSANFAVGLTPGWIIGPGSIAITPPAANQSPTQLPADPVTIGVVDSGSVMTDTLASELASVGGRINLVGSGVDVGVDYVHHHGTFIAAMLGRLLPGVTIEMENAPFDVNSTVRSWEVEPGELTVLADDYSLAAALTARFEGSGVDVLSLSLGTYGCPTLNGDEYNPADVQERFRAPQATRAALLRLKVTGSVGSVVAAAGNDSSETPFYPAAFATDASFVGGDVSVCTEDGPNSTWLYSVGSTQSTNSGAQRPVPSNPGARFPAGAFSNHGCWVTTIADGSDITSHDGDIWKSWSGTSFATPCVAAHLASGQTIPVREVGAGDPAIIECGLGDGSPPA
jgi:hypothetical protein